MIPPSIDPNAQQGVFFKVLLSDIISPKHALIKLGEIIDWGHFEKNSRRVLLRG